MNLPAVAGLFLFLFQAERTPLPNFPKEKEIELRRIYAPELAAKSQESVLKLLNDAAKTKDDPATRRILLELAFKHAGELFLFREAFKAIETLDALHQEVDPIALKGKLLDEARKKSKSPEQADALATADLDLAISAFVLGKTNPSHYNAANKSAENAAKGAKLIKNKSLEDKAAGVSRYAADLSKDGAGPFPLAKFRYFILEQSDNETLNVIANGSDAKLKKIANLKLLGGEAAENFFEYGDAAYQAANDTDRSAFEKTFLQRDALESYTTALSIATGATKTKYERDPQLKKRIAELEKSAPVPFGQSGPTVDLLALIEPNLHKVAGEWQKEGPVLTGSPGPYARIQIPYEPPEEFDLILHFERKMGSTFIMGFPGRAMLALDGYGGGLTCLETVDGKKGDQNETTFKGSVLGDGKKFALTCAIRKTGIAVTLDDRKLVDWRESGNGSRCRPTGPFPTTGSSGSGVGTASFSSARSPWSPSPAKERKLANGGSRFFKNERAVDLRGVGHRHVRVVGKPRGP
jgi:hypothetical protein